ncbi:MAG: CHASE2 domain-containing protein [Heteroscytonema crispum UTEX LB 1556]
MKKVLILAANPKDTTRLRLDEEVRDIEEGLQRSQKRDQFSLKQQSAVRPRDIQRAVLEFKPQIVHFSGHGTEEKELIFEDETGKSKLVSGAALADFFKLFADTVECVVLNGCYSAVQADAIAEHINYVIGMNQAIGDKAAIEFAVGFYDALGAGETIQFAYKFGCSAIRMAGIEEHLTPVLLKKPEVTASTVEPSPTKKDSLPEKIKKWRKKIPWDSLPTIFGTSTGVTFLALVVRFGGALQSLELAAYDDFMRFQLSSPFVTEETPDKRLLIIKITRDDAIKEEKKANDPKEGGKNGTLTDSSLHELLNKLLEKKPRAIGLDILRNYKSKNTKLEQLLKNNDSPIYAVCKVPENSTDKGIAPPYEISPDRVGFNDGLIGGEETVLRRQILSMNFDSNPESLCKSKDSISLKLARKFLEQEKGKNQDAYDSQGNLQNLIINNVFFQSLSNPDAGGYRGTDLRGYQILLDYRSFCQSGTDNESDCSPHNISKTYSLKQVLEDNLLKEEDVKNRIVLIGVEDNSYANDLVNTPFTAKSKQEMPGFIVQAQMVSNIWRVALGEQRQLLPSPLAYDFLWILTWSLIGSILVYHLYKSPLKLLVYGVVAIASLYILCLIFFISPIKLWVPLVPPAFTFLGSGVIVFIRFRFQQSY